MPSQFAATSDRDPTPRITEEELQASEERRELTLRILSGVPLTEEELEAREPEVRDIVRSMWWLRELAAEEAEACEKARAAEQSIYDKACSPEGYDLAGSRYKKRVRDMNEAVERALARIPQIAQRNTELQQALRDEVEHAFAEAVSDLERLRCTIEILRLPPAICNEVAPRGD